MTDLLFHMRHRDNGPSAGAAPMSRGDATWLKLWDGNGAELAVFGDIESLAQIIKAAMDLRTRMMIDQGTHRPHLDKMGIL